jgi:hypothetical protein
LHSGKNSAALEKRIAVFRRSNLIVSALRILPQCWSIKEKIQKLEAAEQAQSNSFFTGSIV